MRWSSNFIAPLAALVACGAAWAQTPDYKNVGRAPTEQEVQVMDIAIGQMEKNFRQGVEPLRTARRYLKQNVRYATAPTSKEARWRLP